MWPTSQSLNAYLCPFSQQQVLTDEQTAWVKKTQEKVMDLLRETPPDGDKFAVKMEVSVLFGNMLLSFLGLVICSWYQVENTFYRGNKVSFPHNN